MSGWKNLAFLFLIPIIFLTSCRNEVPTPTDTVNIAIDESPETLFPLLAKSTIAGQISSKIYLPMADFNPATLELEPVLLEDIPQPVVDSTGEIYTFRLDDKASWSDGRPVTANDVLFTLKLIANPFKNFGSVRSTLANITELDAPDPTAKNFTVVFNGSYHLDIEAFTNLPLLPAHVLDPNSEMAKYSWDALIHYQDSLNTKKDSIALVNLANQVAFLEDDFTRHVGTGPYQVGEWIPNQRLTLTRLNNYWGEKSASSNIDLKAYPSQINYLILPEQITALAALKDDQVNILPDVDEETIDMIKKDPILAKNFNIISSDVLQYYYIGMNNEGALLKDHAVRSALAHLVNVNQIIQSLMGGNAERVISPVLHQKPYYVKDLQPVEYDPDKAASLLDEAGYQDRNNDGTRVKIIDGKPQKLSFSIMTTGKQLGKDVATLLKNEAQKVGIEIRIEVMDFPKMLERIKSGKYDLANLVVKQFPGLDDPYIGWNSANAYGKGSNYSNVNDPEIDRITEAIRTTHSVNNRQQLYRDFQRRIVEIQPVIFLFSPKNNIVIKDGMTIVTSARRPGYFENTAR
ncbi:MAG: peptide ABC transporter substrate-binding protein [Saprospiraceae bacterium]|nr:peptide ABC transporter substrate-binding protein [Saprospiraceae bacterium]